MINNFEQIKKLLEFRSEDDFYFLQILQRKKDHPAGKVNGTNNNSRLIKAYFIKSIEHLEFVEPEIIELCKLFQARAGINLNRRSFKKMALQHLRKVTDQILSEDFHKSHRAYNTVCGKHNHDSDKKWILDIDNGDVGKIELLHLPDCIKEIEPTGDKLIATIPSKNGLHLIVKPFNLKVFSELKDYTKIEIHKNNPTNLFIP